MARTLIATPLGQFEPATLLAIAVATAVVAVAAYRRLALRMKRRRFQLEHGCQPPPSYSLMNSVFGLAQFSGRRKAAKEHRLLQYASKNFETLGPTWRSNVFGQEVILTIQPENIKTMLSLKFKEYGLANRERTLGPLLGHGIFTSDGEPWAHSRAMIRPNFARDQVADLASLERHVQALLRLLPHDDPAAVVDLQERFFQLTIDSATEFLFGQSTHTLEAAAERKGGKADDFANDFTVAQRWCAERGRLGLIRPIHDLFGDGAGQRAIKNCHAFVDRFVDEAVRYREKVAAAGGAELPDDEEVGGEKRKYVFLHELARSTDDKRRLRDELLNVLLAGRDTTASLLSNMWFCIAKRPEVFARLRREVEEQLGGELPTYEQVKNLKYLKWCMNECKSPFPDVISSNGRSPPHPPRRPRQLPPRLPGHPAPHRRRAERHRARLRRQGHHRRLLDLRDAPPPRHLRR
jgi:cytochrome P450